MRLGILCSGNGTNFENIVRTCYRDEVVIMNHNKKNCGAVKRAAKFGIPHCYIKSEYEHDIVSLLQAWDVDLVILAGWMRIVTNKLLDAFPDKVINLHPSLLPKYKGLNAIQQAIDAKVQITGCTAHYVQIEVDSGSTIIQAAIPINYCDKKEYIKQSIQKMEHRILPLAVAIVAKSIREKIKDNK